MKILHKLIIIIAVFTTSLITGCCMLPPVDKSFAAGEHVQQAKMAGGANLVELARPNKNRAEALTAANGATPPAATTGPDSIVTEETSVTITSERVVKPRLNYTVSEGELLWSIAKRPDIYGDPLLWPILYQANRDQIKDPRKIYAGQILSIPRNISENEREDARNRAKKSNIFSHE